MARSRPPSLWLGISLYCLLCPDLVFHLVPGWLPLLYLLVHLQERDSQGCKFLAIWRCFTCLYVYINIIWSFLFCNDSSIGYVIIISAQDKRRLYHINENLLWSMERQHAFQTIYWIYCWGGEASVLSCFLSRAWGVIKENSRDFSSPDGIGSRIWVLWPFQPHMVRSRHTCKGNSSMTGVWLNIYILCYNRFIM